MCSFWIMAHGASMRAVRMAYTADFEPAKDVMTTMYCGTNRELNTGSIFLERGTVHSAAAARLMQRTRRVFNCGKPHGVRESPHRFQSLRRTAPRFMAPIFSAPA